MLPQPFKTELVLRWISDGVWAVNEPLIVNVKIGLVAVPVGFVTDGPSIPKMPLLYEEFRDRAWPAAVVHDWLYSKECPIDISRDQADETFHELMDALYPGWIDRVKNDDEYAGVRACGEMFFRKKD